MPGILEEIKSPEKEEVVTESCQTSLNLQTQVPVTESASRNEVVQKNVKTVYIEKEVKNSKSEEILESSTIVQPTLRMTQIQQPGLTTFQNVPKLARSTVVQQLLKVPTTGPSTLQVSFDSFI